MHKCIFLFLVVTTLNMLSTLECAYAQREQQKPSAEEELKELVQSLIDLGKDPGFMLMLRFMSQLEAKEFENFRTQTREYTALQDKAGLRVKVDVTAEEPLKNKIASYIKRELRSLQDVIVTDSNVRFSIRVVALEHKLMDGRKTGGFTLSIVCTELFDAFSDPVFGPAFWNLNKGSKSATEMHRESKQYSLAYTGARMHRVLHVPQGNLRQVCEEIVTDLDNDVFEQWRDKD